MQKGMPFLWSNDWEQAFLTLKEKLIQAPVLAYPKLGANASTFTLETDASAVGIGAVLEQHGHPVAYVSRALKKAENNYNVIQQECLAIVFATKQFRHYLLGRPFTVLTDMPLFSDYQDKRWKGYCVGGLWHCRNMTLSSDIVKAPRTAMQMHSLAVTPRLKNGQLLLHQEQIGIC